MSFCTVGSAWCGCTLYRFAISFSSLVLGLLDAPDAATAHADQQMSGESDTFLSPIAESPQCGGTSLVFYKANGRDLTRLQLDVEIKPMAGRELARDCQFDLGDLYTGSRALIEIAEWLDDLKRTAIRMRSTMADGVETPTRMIGGDAR